MRTEPHEQVAQSKDLHENTESASGVQAGDFDGPPRKAVEPSRIPIEFLTGPDVQARYRKSHVTIWRWIRDSELEFPPPIKINRLNYWRLSDLEAWEAVQAAA